MKLLVTGVNHKTAPLEVRERLSFDHNSLPPALADFNLESSADGSRLIYTYDTDLERTGITALLQKMHETGLALKDLKTSQSSLEEIFVRLVNTR